MLFGADAWHLVWEPHTGCYEHFLQTGYAEAKMSQDTYWDMEVDWGGQEEGVSPLAALWEKLHFF